MACLTDEQWASFPVLFEDGEPRTDEAVAINEHIEGCAACQEKADKLGMQRVIRKEDEERAQESIEAGRRTTFDVMLRDYSRRSLFSAS